MLPEVIAVNEDTNKPKFIKAADDNVKHPVCENPVPKKFKFIPATLDVEKDWDDTFKVPYWALVGTVPVAVPENAPKRKLHPDKVGPPVWTTKQCMIAS